MFSFKGELEISKSWMNRALILKSYKPDLKILGHSQSKDVVLLEHALNHFLNGETQFDAGLGGTTFRFLAFRISRKPGEYLIQVSDSLRKRPSQELIQILKQLSVESYWSSEGFHILSKGWILPKKPLQISVDQSSQFLSALILNSVELDFDFQIQNLPENFKSQSYFKMTEDLLLKCGIQWGKSNQLIQAQTLFGELDISSAFSLISAAVLSGQVCIHNFTTETLQPDLKFLEFFKQMGISYKMTDNEFSIEKQDHFRSLKADLSDCPDLFPVLSVLCAFAEGQSELLNAPQLRHKESDRIAKTLELLISCGFKAEEKNDGIQILGQPDLFYRRKDFILFDTAHDHRMAMAAAILILKGFPIRMNDPSVVGKSYPDFYKHIQLDGL